MSGDGDTVDVGPVRISISTEDYDDLCRLRAMERFIDGAMSEWIDGCARLMALYPDRTWDEVLIEVVEEITEARAEQAR